MGNHSLLRTDIPLGPAFSASGHQKRVPLRSTVLLQECQYMACSINTLHSDHCLRKGNVVHWLGGVDPLSLFAADGFHFGSEFGAYSLGIMTRYNYPDIPYWLTGRHLSLRYKFKEINGTCFSRVFHLNHDLLLARAPLSACR